ncbi:Elongation of very long chain fatty acids protein 7 [Fasciolopsis buskii]|uniref:Elongation of very long chain fatty acids protein n=1 Tax=Fasciolopsis buskii TaxID=27845 RepID=A0A8E0RVI4_9TREM|nr:Elongation of very long chain fatty acids protein 7 [Fasciolopsis buski]
MQVMDMLPKGDPRVENWPLMDSPVPTFAIVTFYLIFVLWLGPKLMARRSTGFNMRSLMLIYNLAMVLFSGWLWYEFCAAGWFGGGYTLGCQPVDRSRRPKAMRMAQVCWFFFISKLFELFDTACFVLRKKFDQVSFLHVFHHAVMPLSWWFGVKYVPGGISTFHAMLNSFIHFLMYSYYGLAAAGPRYRQYLWWKKHLTTAQIIQFIVVIFHSVYTLTLHDCNYPKLFNYMILSYALIFLVLFSNFYSQVSFDPENFSSFFRLQQNGARFSDYARSEDEMICLS